MSKQDLLKSQTCVLRVSIHCDGCKHKVKKLLQKIDGVYTVNIDAEHGKVTVTGNVNPDMLIKKLVKSGKHAELWGGSAQKGSNNFQNQFKNMQALENFAKNNKSQNNAKVQQEMLKQIMKGASNNNKDQANSKVLSSKDKKSVKFEESDGSYDDDDEDYSDDEDDDEDDHGFNDDFDDGVGIMMPIKGGKGNGVNGTKGSTVPNVNGKSKKGGGIKMPMSFKGMLSGKIGGGKSENGGKKSGGADGKTKEGDKKKGGEGKNGGKNGNNEQKKGKNKGGGGAISKGNVGGGNKKGGGKNDGLNEIDINTNGKVGGGGMGQMGQMGQMGNFPFGQMGQIGNNHAVQGLPTPSAMNGGYYQGMGPNNPYSNNQQQYMAMMMNQQRQNGNGMYQPMMYARPQAPMNYGPQPVHVDQYTHMFSDENTGSCSIM